MKKILLSLFALIAMVGMVNAQRAWAYGLKLTSEDNVYTFTFNAVTAGNATLVFYQDAEQVATLDLGTVSAGANTVSKKSVELLNVLSNSGDYTWAVTMSGSAISLSGNYLTELTAAGQGLDFYLPQGVVVDNNPESETFGTLFIAEAQGGKLSAGPTHTRGIFYYDPTLTELNTPETGAIPSNVTLSNTTRQAMHRIAINPKNNHVAFAYNVSGSPAVWSVPSNNLSGEAVNLIAGTEIKMPNSICFDENGALYVMDNANATTGGTLYKVVDGVATKITQNEIWAHVDNSLAYDGRGGIWIAQSVDDNNWPSYEILSHINKNGEIDWKSSDYKSTSLFSNANEDGYSKRGQVAYSMKDHLLVFGGNERTHIFQVTYDATTGTPSLGNIYKYRTPWIKDSGNIDGLAFDYAGDLYVMSAMRERLYKYVIPTDNNTCTTPAPKSQVITLETPTAVAFTVTANANDDAMGAVEGAGVYYEGETVTLTAKPNAGHAFVDWSNGATTPTLTFVAEKDTTVTANFNILSYTLTVNVNDETRGSVDFTTGTYEYGTEVKVTATPEDGYEFAGWSNGSKANPLTITVKKDETITANFRAILASSITLNALPVQDYSASIVGTVKRAIQNGENTIVLTHEANGTPHIYNVAHATNTVTEISQEGVVAVDPENAGDLLAISDIALTEDGKLLAINKIVCQNADAQVNAGYKRGETRVYIWNDLAGVPTLWFTSKMSSNWYRSVQGHTMAYKGTSTNGTLFTTGVTATGTTFRYSVYNVIDGVYTDPAVNDSEYYHFTKGSAQTTENVGANYEINVSPLAESAWVLDGNLTNPFEITDPLTYNTEVTAGTTINDDLGKKYNGASYLANYNEHHLMLAPYVAEDKLTGVKVLGITDGFATATVVETNTTLETAVDATAAAATAYVDGDGDLTIYLWADAKVYTFSEKEQTDGPATAIDNTIVAPQVQKIVRNGQVLIIRDGKTYNMMGQEVK